MAKATPAAARARATRAPTVILIGYGRDATNADPLLEVPARLPERMGQARHLLTGAERTAFFFVTLPEALPIAVISRFNRLVPRVRHPGRRGGS